MNLTGTNNGNSEHAGIVRNNHYNLYDKLADCCSSKSGHLENYSFLMTSQMEWPNMIYDLKFDSHNGDILFKELTEKILQKQIPELLITETFSKSEGFEKLSKAHGFIPVMRWPGMIMFPDTANTNESRHSALRITRVSSSEQMVQWIAIANKTLFTARGLDADMFLPLAMRDDLSIFLGYEHQIPVSTMLVNYYQDNAGLYIGSTLPEFEHRGYMSAMIRYTLHEALRRGCTSLILEANSSSYKLYERLGFKFVSNFDIYWKMHSAIPVK